MSGLGRAAYEAQHFEYLLGALYPMLIIRKGDRSQFYGQDGKTDQDKLDTFFRRLDKATIGDLKRDLAGLEMLSDETIRDIAELNSERVKLTHHFYVESVEKLQTPGGRQSLIEELDATRKNFADANAALTSVVSGLRTGILQEVLDTQ